MMNTKDRILLFSAHNVTRLLAGLEKHEKTYLAKYFPQSIEASADSPHRADEPFEMKTGDIVKGVGGDPSARPNVNFQNLMDDGLETLSAFLKVRRGVLSTYRSLRENRGLRKTEAGTDFYAKLKKHARNYGIDLIGFTRVPDNLIFQGKRVLYRNAIVCAQEMKKSAIEMAPEADAGLESLHVYANLGTSMNRLASFIRSQGIPCQVSHPLGGLLLYPALAVKAGLGYFGRQGLLITPQYGVRQRLGIILVPLEDIPVTDNNDHKWVLDFCDLCNLCLKCCPGKAVLDKARLNMPDIYTSIDKMKCSPWFSLWLGCSICVKVCPFSRKPYDHIKQAYERHEPESVIE
jgi:epoxyqueuosine reductase